MPAKIGIGPLKKLNSIKKTTKKLFPKVNQEVEFEYLNREKECDLVKNYERTDFFEQKTAAVIQSSLNEEEEGQLSVDVYQTESEIVIVAPVAGITPEDLTVSITDDVISIQGKREIPLDIPEESFYTRECFWGEFSRSIVLPEAVDATKVKATFKKGILKIMVPKIEQIRTRIIKIAS